MIRFMLGVIAVVLSGCSAPEVARQLPPDAIPFRIPDEGARLFWDLKDEPPGPPTLSVARDAGLYPGLPDTLVDLRCGSRGGLNIGSERLGVPTTFLAAQKGPRLSILVSGAVLSGPDQWRDAGHFSYLEEIRLSPTAAQFRSLLSDGFCLVDAWDDGEGRSCCPAPPPAMAAKFLNACGAGSEG